MKIENKIIGFVFITLVFLLFGNCSNSFQNDDGDVVKEDPKLPVLEPTPSEFIAFEGAEGGGMKTTGGNKGGVVYFVNTLEDNSTGNVAAKEGSLRWCLKRPGKKIIFFKVAGIIHLKSRLDVLDNTTIAGQTAPGDGICIADNTMFVRGDNVIIRYMRFRLGDVSQVEDDALWGRNCTNVIIDHCSMSWSLDECSSFYDNTNFTMQWCILSESLRNSGHIKGAHGFGGIWGGINASYHHNLLAHHDSRNPRLTGSIFSNAPESQLVDLRNNVIYNWGNICGYGGEGGSFNLVNNYYKPTIYSKNPTRFFAPNADNGNNNQVAGVWGQFYASGNYMNSSSVVTSDNWLGIYPKGNITKDEIRSNMEFEAPFVTTQSAEEGYETVLNLVGASFKRDATDARVINEVRNGLAPVRASNGTTKGGFIDSQEDVGGWDSYSYDPSEVPVDVDNDGMPDNWEIEKGLSQADPSDANTYNFSPIYSNVEVYMNDLVKNIK